MLFKTHIKVLKTHRGKVLSIFPNCPSYTFIKVSINGSQVSHGISSNLSSDTGDSNEDSGDTIEEVVGIVEDKAVLAAEITSDDETSTSGIEEEEKHWWP